MSGLFWLAVSIFVSTESVRTGLGTFHDPGPGFLPFCSAVIFGVFGSILIVTNLVKKEWEGRVTDLWKRVEWKKVVWVLFSLFLYSFILSKIGYLIATFGLMTFLFGVMRQPKWWIREAATALTITLITYFFFRVLMGIQLPKGLLDL